MTKMIPAQRIATRSLTARRIRTVYVIAAFGTAVIGLLNAIPANASTANDNDDRNFPGTAPDWYSTASPPIYADGLPGKWVEWENKSEGLKINYFSPQGGFPGDDKPDIYITSAARESDPASSTEQRVTIDPSSSPQLRSDLGTMTAGFVLPKTNSALQLTDPELPADDVTVNSGGSFTITRPPIPADCNADDPQVYEVLLAMLSQDQRKYLVEAEATFPDRIKARDAQCAAAANADQSSATPTAAPASIGADSSSVQQQPVQTSQSGAPGDDWFPFAVFLALLAVIATAVWILAKRYGFLGRHHIAIQPAAGIPPSGDPSLIQFDNLGNHSGSIRNYFAKSQSNEQTGQEVGINV